MNQINREIWGVRLNFVAERMMQMMVESGIWLCGLWKSFGWNETTKEYVTQMHLEFQVFIKRRINPFGLGDAVYKELLNLCERGVIAPVD